MRIRLIAAVAALLLAITGTVLIAGYVTGADERAQADASPVDVYVVDQLIPVATPAEVLGEYLRVQVLPSAAVAEGAVTDLATVAGMITTVQLLPGEQLLTSRLANPEDLITPGKIRVPEGMQEVTISLAADAMVGGQVAAGDTVGVFVTKTNDAQQPSTNLVFNKVLVTTVQGAPAVVTTETGATDDSATPATPDGALMITFALTAADAERIIFAVQNASIWLSLQTDDDNEDGTKIVTEADLY
ncbi:Flp pilus assembly protein CpaB [Cryobacterium sp. SO2]|uniref:Flp pilus assembly protein CpaB n=1 Tax=Cryobacterium sp. SO2 TaxID=1897060 RepID=UPI00223CC0FC|nr:Flp pilus assembly protein CpaB [Cryobacterium sp. SO2]WEO78005.1 Flp pilus assembly protein CpaB [Cryobacterium sp. SO2]